MDRLIKILFVFTIAILAICSFGFVDPNMVLSTNPLYSVVHAPLAQLVYHYRPWMSGLFFVLLCLLLVCYIYVLKHADSVFFAKKKIVPILLLSSVLLLFSYPAFSYDLFNYMTTAKVAFTWHENPYLVMPVEIPNEPYLAFTRAANKVALYGPVWILITAIPHFFGSGSIWGTIIAFKALNVILYGIFAFLIYKVTKSWKNVLFFVFNPLVLIEVLISGHNDIYMMLFAVLGLLFWEQKKVLGRIAACCLFLASFFIKGATVILVPVLFIKNITRERILIAAYGLLAIVFFIGAPLREELYPWYAVWLITIASFMDMKKYAHLLWFTVVLSFALELRNLPYMWMGYYEGLGPMLRIVFTVVPIVVYFVFIGILYITRKTK